MIWSWIDVETNLGLHQVEDGVVSMICFHDGISSTTVQHHGLYNYIIKLLNDLFKLLNNLSKHVHLYVCDMLVLGKAPGLKRRGSNAVKHKTESFLVLSLRSTSMVLNLR
jgi:hypothetical protein